MVCFLSLGSDPTQAIMDLAKEHKLECRDISMGQGQEVHARKLVSEFQEMGGWVLLQNCHLALEFMPELQHSVQEAESCHENFRLWITTEEHPKFPINLLQASLKFTNEPPQGTLTSFFQKSFLCSQIRCLSVACTVSLSLSYVIMLLPHRCQGGSQADVCRHHAGQARH